jgi:hypothetical protein
MLPLHWQTTQLPDMYKRIQSSCRRKKRYMLKKIRSHPCMFVHLRAAQRSRKWNAYSFKFFHLASLAHKECAARRPNWTVSFEEYSLSSAVFRLLSNRRAEPLTQWLLSVRPSVIFNYCTNYGRRLDLFQLLLLQHAAAHLVKSFFRYWKMLFEVRLE